MKWNKLTIILLAVAICIPAIVARIYYKNTLRDPLSEATVSHLSITLPNGTEQEYDADHECTEPTLGDNMIRFFVDLNNRAQKIKELPEHVSEQNCYSLVFTAYGTEYSYRYYFTTSAEYAYLQDHEGTVYHIAKEDAIAFLKSSLSSCLYADSRIPVLTLNEIEVLPFAMQWQYAYYENEYREVQTTTSDQMPTFEVYGGVETLLQNDRFDIAPDYTWVQVFSNDVKIYEGTPDRLNVGLFDEEKVYTFIWKTTWVHDSASTDPFGEATYRFLVRINPTPVFYLSTQEVDPGDFVVITAKHITDPSKIAFTSSPSLNFTPTFFTDGDVVRALIPVTTDLNQLEKTPDKFTFTLSYAGEEQNIQLKVKSKTFKQQTYDIGIDLINAYRNQAALAQFHSVIDPILNQGTQTKYFDNSPFQRPGGEASTGTGFGLYRTLSATGETYRHEGVDYVIYGKSHDAVAAMAGKVVYVGNLTLTGNIVVVDHGFGLHSIYAHLSEARVKVGDIVKKGQSVGVCGSTGFTKGLNLHFGLYVYGTPVSPYGVYDYGMQMTEPD